jgi:adenosylmethionine-8-amino-7-oxononanoate aminotransferase
MNLLERDQKSVWHPFSPMKGGFPILPVQKARGIYLYTEDGNRIIDAISSWWVNTHGHCNTKIAEAISRQANELEQVIFAGFTHGKAVELSEKILERLIPEGKVFFSDDGSTTVEVAIKMALQYWFNKNENRTKIIAIDGSYHGDTFGAMSVGERNEFTEPYGTKLFDVDFISFPDGENDDEVIKQMTDLLEGSSYAAFIFEPLVQGAGGMRIYSSETLDRLIALASSKGIICIADEVMTGFGRTGKLFASDYLQNKPDIYCLSKGLTGGFLPLGLTVANKNVVDEYDSDDVNRTFFHGHSFTANPISCAAALASFDLTTSKECQIQIDMISYSHREFEDKIRHLDKVLQVKTLGTILSITIVPENTTNYFDSSREKIYNFFLDRGILLRPLGNVLYLLPPYVIKLEELEFIYDKIIEFLES